MSPDCGIVAVPFSCLPCRFVPLLGPPHLVISCCLLGLPMPSTLCRLSSPASRHHLVLSSRHLVRHLWQFACVLLCVPPCVPFLATPLVSLLVSLFVSPLVSFSPGDVIAVLPDRPPLVPFGFAVIARPAMLVDWLGAGRDGIASLAIVCPPCRRCLLWDGVGLCLFRLRRPACLLDR